MENNTKFADLGFSLQVLDSIREMGFEYATPIQARAIPCMLQGNDLIGQAQTGTGKTAAFGLPLLEMIDPSNKNVQALILCPTRELCVQITDELTKMARHSRGIEILSVYGGDSIMRQIKALKAGVNIVVGTPGRVMDHQERKTLKLENLRFAVLDEADEMLNMGFREDIENILACTPKNKQTVMFSATMSKPILDISSKFLRSPEMIKVMGKNVTASTIEQVYFETRGQKKAQIISKLIHLNDFQLALVFCNTKARVDQITEELRKMGHKAEALHGDLSQNLRNQVLGRFKQSEINILVATDVAARGLDVNNVDAVFNYDIPHDTEYYVHRIGRTGRAGKPGKAYSFAESRKDDQKIRELEKFIKTNIERARIPSQNELLQSKIERIENHLHTIATENNLADYEQIVQSMYQRGFDPHLLATCLLKNMLDIQNISLKKVEEEMEPIRERERSSERSTGTKPSFGGRERRDPRETARSGEAKVRMHIALGKKDQVKPGDIVGAITGECKISGKEIGVIDMFDHFSFFEISEVHVRKVLKEMKKNTIKGKKVMLSIARN